MELQIVRKDEPVLTHWGIKGQKWGIRRYQNEDGTLTAAGKKRYYYQNPDGSLTEEGKKHYMTAARKGKLDPKKLSDKDLDMINNRFNKEKQYAQNISDYEKSKFSYKLKEAMITRIKGNGGGGGKGGKKGGGGGGGGKGIGNLLAMPIKKAFEDAMKFDPNKGNGGGKDDDERDTSKKDYKRYQKNGHRFVESYKPEKLSKEEREANRRRGERFVQEGRTAEDVLRGRSHGSSGRSYATEDRTPRSVRGLPSGGIYMDPSEYSIHSGITRYKVTRKPQSDELMHFGIKGQKWGVRRFQNEDRTLTEAGKERYGVGGGEKRSSNSEYDYKSERRKVGENRPEGFSKKENEIITKIQNGEIVDSETVRKIASDHHSNRFELGKKYQASTSESEKAELKSQMEHEQILMDYAYDKIPAMNRENKYEKEIASETDSKYIDPTYRKFSSKEEKAAAEAEYLNHWHSGMPDDEAEAKKWERECQHLSDRVWSMSFDGYDGKPQSERVRSMFDYDPDGYRDYERWKPKYEKTEEWKKLQSERQTLKDKTGYTKAEEALQKAGKEGLYFKDKAAWSKLNHALSDAQRKYEKRVDASDIRKGERKIEDAFYNEVTKYVLQDLGYEVTDKNIKLIQSVIWYD